jgi:uncharacterized membrane protein YkgB
MNNQHILKWAVPLLRVSLGTILLWFGLTKLLDLGFFSSLNSSIFAFFPDPIFLNVAGTVEVIIGICLLLNFLTREMIVVLWFQLAGVLLSFMLNPDIFFMHNNSFFLTVEGEFIIKNLLLIASSVMLFAHTSSRRARSGSSN